MGNSGSNAGRTPQITDESLAAEKKKLEAYTVVPSKASAAAPSIEDLVKSVESGAVTNSAKDLKQFEEFRNELLSFSLGESAFDYAERLFAAQPNNPHLMALLAETATSYDEVKNKDMRRHWVDRMDLLQRAVDVSRKCIKENPDFGPCYRTYVTAACRASESLYYYRWMKGMGLTENYHGIMKRVEKAVELMPEDGDVANMGASLNARCAGFAFFPYICYNWMYGLPSKKQLLDKACQYGTIAVQRDPGNLEFMCRLGSAYYQNKELDKARKCYRAVRDEMIPRSLADEKWQSMAHTMVATGFDKNRRWNLPFS